ncbi:MAG TPA: nicotinate (nicotinamide) nucleotide adenylyltransferase [Phycisphaerae bacterium]|nr:nicotinate (nicotinamide) nucleotide adenylyltransferase [Phycisphaerae bacterium]
MHTLIYGGTFDPIHHGHLITCQRARELLRADRVLFIPAFISPHKQHHQSASSEHRLAMLHAAIAHHPFFLADARELARGEAQGKSGGGPSYTIDTLESLRAENPADRLTLLIGQDQLPKLHTWHRIGELVDMIEIAVLGRPSAPAKTAGMVSDERARGGRVGGGAAGIEPLMAGNEGDSIEKNLEVVAQNLGPAVAARLKLEILHTPLIQISSTDLRERVRQGLPLDFLVPPAVADYIQNHGLYRPE